MTDNLDLLSLSFTPEPNMLLYYYLCICFFYILKRYVLSNKYIDLIFTESNVTIRLLMPLVLYLFLDYNKLIISLVKFIIIIAIRICFSDKLTFKSVVFTYVFCILSSFVSPIISVCILEYCIIYVHPLNMFPNQHHLPD